MTQPLFSVMFAGLMSDAEIIGLADGDQTLSVSVYSNAEAFYVTGVDRTDAAAILPPGVGKVSIWQADPTNAYPCEVKCGTASVSLEPGQQVALITDGTEDGLAASELTGSVSTLAWQVVDGAKTLFAGDHSDLQSGAGAFTVTFPAAPNDFDTLWFSNEDGSLATHTVTLDGNSHPLGSPQAGWTDSRTISTAYARFAFRYFDGNWSIL